MVKFIKKLLDRASDRAIEGSKIGQVDGIILVDSRKRGEGFKTTIENALHLLQQHDPRRYARVKRYIARLINVVTPKSRYDPRTRTLYFEFLEMLRRTDEERTAYYACFLIDRAALQVLQRTRRRKLDRPENEIRRARLYVAEHNRFLEKLVAADLLPFPAFKSFRMEFDEQRRPQIPRKGFWPALLSVIWQAATERKIKKKNRRPD